MEGSPGCSAEDHGGAREVSYGAASFERAGRMFRALVEGPRLRLLELLSRGELCVTEVAHVTGEGMSTVSQRLRVLRGEGLVSGRREGKHIYYALSDSHVEDLLRSVMSHAEEEITGGHEKGKR
ncbi:MAG: metalloregulator ArsR/SmtB family transcription factor [Rubrobacter sp.]|nr:metalloregulator ArsR/SmtB family transcription factor [Rubrobacter sp.]